MIVKEQTVTIKYLQYPNMIKDKKRDKLSICPKLIKWCFMSINLENSLKALLEILQHECNIKFC